MTGWTAATLRAAATWQAFKEGQALFESGAVTAALTDQDGWRGSVRVGQRLLRVTVTVKSATDLATRCACPANQATGELCCHAVATGLAALTGMVAATPLAPPSAPTAAVPPRQILLAANWGESLRGGKLAATVTVCRDAELTDADLRLAAWLASEGVATKETLNLNLTGSRLAALLDAMVGHPRVVYGKDRVPIQLGAGRRFILATADLLNDEVCLVLDPASDAWTAIAGTFWQISADLLVRAGVGAISELLGGVLVALANRTSVGVPLSHLLEQLDPWQDWLVFPPDGWLDKLHFVPAPAAFSLTLDGSLQQVVAHLTVGYGGSPPVPPGLGSVAMLPRLADEQCEIRNYPAEMLAVCRLEHAGFQTLDRTNGRWVLAGESAVLHFLTRVLPALREEWHVTEETRFQHANKLLTVVSPHISIRGSGEDWLSFDLTFQTDDGKTLPAVEVRHLLRAGNSPVKLSGGRRLIIADDLAEIIDPLFSELDLQQQGGHFEASARAGEVVLAISRQLHQSPAKQVSHEDLSFVTPPTLQAQLRPYQMLGAAWLLDRVQRFGGALLADDMGLGKTLQTIALIECLLAVPRPPADLVLVVVTTSLLGNWQAEWGRFAAARRVVVLHGAGRDAVREQLPAGTVVLTSYGTLARDLAWHLQRDYLAVVVDEASLLRNPDTDHAKAVTKLRAAHRIALTGTPVENGVRDLWSIFRFIQPGWLGGREDFRDRYELPLAAGAETAESVMARLKLKTQPFLLRRTKQQVAPELPSKLFIDEFCDLSHDQQAVYRELLSEGRKRVAASADSGNPAAARMQMLTALLRLRQTCCDLALLGDERFKRMLVARRSAKLQRLLELLEEAQGGSHRVLVFSQFQKQLVAIESCVAERGWASLRLDGQTRNRQQMVEQFQSADGPPIFLISLKAGGYGLNLTAADTVIHFDPWWNPAAEAQATDRAHRIGQTRPVTVYRLLTRGTVEDKVVRLQAKKRQLAAAIDESGTGDAAAWSMDDFQTLLAGID